MSTPVALYEYSGKGKQRSADRYYDTMSVEELLAELPATLMQSLAAKDCALLFWTSGLQNANALDVIKGWGFEYKTWAFLWVKTNPSSGIVALDEVQSKDLHWGTGFTTRANAEAVLLASRGAPRRLAKDVHQIVIAPRTDHSEKPEEVARRIERLYPGPYVELFARKQREGWMTWGNEVPPPAGGRWAEMCARPFDYSKLDAGASPDDPWPDLPDFLRRASP